MKVDRRFLVASVSFFCMTGLIYLMPAPALIADVRCSDPIDTETALTVGVTAILEQHSKTTYFGENLKKQQPMHYQGLTDLLVRNPGCCTFTPIGQDDFAPSPEWSELNSFYGFARATFEAFAEDSLVGQRVVSVTKIVAVTDCGEAIWYDVDDDSWSTLGG